MAADADGFTDLLAALTRLMVDEETLEETLARVAYLACSGPIDANNAGVTLQRERVRRPRRTTATPRSPSTRRSTTTTTDPASRLFVRARSSWWPRSRK